MKANTILLNKVEDGDIITFTVWTNTISEITSFIEKVVSVKNVPENLEREHDISMGYWTNIKVPKNDFDKVISDIKNVFKDSNRNILCEDFTQNYWGADML